MAARNLTFEEFLDLKDGMATRLILDHERILSEYAAGPAYKVVHAYPFYLDDNAYVSIVEIQYSVVIKYVHRFYFDGFVLMHTDLSDSSRDFLDLGLLE